MTYCGWDIAGKNALNPRTRNNAGVPSCSFMNYEVIKKGSFLISVRMGTQAYDVSLLVPGSIRLLGFIRYK